MTLVIFKYCVGPNSISYKKCVHTPLGYGEDSAQGHMRFRGRLKLHIPNFNDQNDLFKPAHTANPFKVRAKFSTVFTLLIFQATIFFSFLSFLFIYYASLFVRPSLTL